MDKLDIIGDIHGHFDELAALLEMLGYRKRGGVYEREGRRVVFLGDYIDRGPKQLEVCSMVKSMVEAGSAIALMGNHELNACAMLAQDPGNPGDTLRTCKGEKGARHLSQHSEFLAQCEAAGPGERLRWCEFFMTLPLWADLGKVKAAHACWDPESIRQADKMLKGGRLDWSLLPMAYPKGEGDPLQNGLQKAIEILCKGPEIDLPEGLVLRDAQGHDRKRARAKWWSDSTVGKNAIADSESLVHLGKSSDDAAQAIRASHARVEKCGKDELVFFGHYWMQGEPRIETANHACLDFSIAKRGCLCAYSFDGEKRLDNSKMRWALFGSKPKSPGWF